MINFKYVSLITNTYKIMFKDVECTWLDFKTYKIFEG
jgi:hypothetical protein